jgi:hypothetical protein
MQPENSSRSSSSSSSAGGTENGVQSMGSIPALGMSAATVKARKSTMASFNTFLEEQHQVDETWPSTMESLTEEQANDEPQRRG